MSTVYIDGVAYQADPAQNMLHTALSLGMDLPYFCWHPAMGSVGACRQCAVKQYRNEQDTKGRLVMACMTPAAEGTRISIHDPDAVAFRASITEWLMVNHPHDCPVCDEGGECHLQDMTVMTGHVYRRYRFDKRTHRNQYLGPLVNHEMNRCIQCYRCVRFYRDYAGGRDFDVFATHDSVYFGRHTDGILQSEFSGNLVEICPTGVFTDKSLKQHFTRKWDLQTAPSICVHCSLGCNTIAGERYGMLRRIRNRYNQHVNGYFLCDRGRYGYDFVNSPERIRHPALGQQPASTASSDGQDAWGHVQHILHSGTTLLGIGSPRASLEDNFALRSLVGAEHFYPGISAQEARLGATILQILQDGPVASGSLHEAATADAVVVLGEDLTNTAPMLGLAVRQAAKVQPSNEAVAKRIDSWNDYSVREASQERLGPVYVLTPAATKLDDVARRTVRSAPQDIARLGFAVAHALDASSPAVPGMTDEVQAAVNDIASNLKAAKQPVIISGTSLGSEALLQACANIAWALHKTCPATRLIFVVPEANSLGLALLSRGDLEQALKAIQAAPNATLVILENDLYRRADRSLVDNLLAGAAHVIAIDSLENETTARAEVKLPAATFAETDGTLVNNEGRAQRFFQVMEPADEVLSSWRWIDCLMETVMPQQAGKWKKFDDLTATLAKEVEVFAAVPQVAPQAAFRVVAQKIPRQPHRYSGRTAMNANINVNEPKPPDDPDSPLSFSMEGFSGEPPTALLPRYWAPGWNSVQSLNKFQAEVGGPLRGGDPGTRLIEPDANKSSKYFDEVPAAFAPRNGEFLLVPRHHIYGSEELSRRAPAIGELVPPTYASVSSSTARRIKAEEGSIIQVRLGDASFELELRTDGALPDGIVGIPVGCPGISVKLPAWGKIQPVERKPNA